MIESKIDELIAALDRTTAALAAVPKARATKATAAPEQTQPVASLAAPAAPAPAAPAPAAPAPAAIVPPAQSPAVSSPPDAKLLVKATDMVILLANEHSRETALGIIGKVRVSANGDKVAGVTRCSDLRPEFWQTVLDEAEEAIAQAQAKAATASLV
jgi:hypothetical protein